MALQQDGRVVVSFEKVPPININSVEFISTQV